MKRFVFACAALFASAFIVDSNAIAKPRVDTAGPIIGPGKCRPPLVWHAPSQSCITDILPGGGRGTGVVKESIGKAETKKPE